MPSSVQLRKVDTTLSSKATAPNPGRRFFGFALVSGAGWLIDVALTMGVVYAGAQPFWASLVGAGAAVTFVYFVSLRRVFEIGGRVGERGFPYYFVWQVFAITAASLIVAVLANLLSPVGAAVLERLGPEGWGDPLTMASGAIKVLITPLTLLANYLFMTWLVKRLQGNA